jgi:hypothetical protein
MEDEPGRISRTSLEEGKKVIKRLAYLAFVVVAIPGAMILTTNVAQSQGGGVKNVVWVQAVTPGVSQSGHSNISGTARAGAFVGGGIGLTGLNASNITVGTLADGRLSANVPLKNTVNVFTNLNQFNAHVGINTNVGASANSLFDVHNATSGAGVYSGMYVSTTNTDGWPFYGYATGGGLDAWTYVHGASNAWRLSVGGADQMEVTGGGQFGFGGLTGSDCFTFTCNGAVTDGIRIINNTLNNTARIFLNGGGNFGTIQQVGNGDILRLENDGLTLNIHQNGHFGINTSTPVGSEDMTILSTNTGFGGVVVNVNSATGEPFYGYRNTAQYSWTYLDDTTNEWRLFHDGDRIRVGDDGHTGVGIAPQVSAIFAAATPATANTFYAGYFEGNGTTNAGFGPIGMWGRVPSSTMTLARGVYGSTNSTGATTYGVYCFGNFAVTATKAFIIDHPEDPTNKYLKHYCHEGDKPENVYNGLVTTDGNGYAWVDLPSYFGEINLEPRYQLTVIDDSDDFVMAKITNEVQNNKFRIRTSKPNVKVSWEVKAIRNDRFVQRHGAPTELDKPEDLKGTYIDPRLYDQSMDLSEENRMILQGKQQAELEKQRAPKYDWTKVQPKRAPKKQTSDR